MPSGSSFKKTLPFADDAAGKVARARHRDPLLLPVCRCLTPALRHSKVLVMRIGVQAGYYTQ